MQPTSRLENPRTAMKLHALISDLRWRVQLLDSDIQDEEKRTGISNVSNLSDPCPKSENQTWQSLGHDHDAGEPVGRNGRGRLTINRWRWLRRTVEGPLPARGEGKSAMVANQAVSVRPVQPHQHPSRPARIAGRESPLVSHETWPNVLRSVLRLGEAKKLND